MSSNHPNGPTEKLALQV